MKTIAIVDGDIIAYRCAASNERRSVKATHNITGQVSEHAHRTGFKEHIRDLFTAEEFTLTDQQHPDDIKFALQAIKTTIEALCKSCGTEEYEVYISGKNNFRDSLPLPTKYKSNRKDSIRPVQLKECREYLVKHHNAVIVDNEEPDDVLARRCYDGLQQGIKTVACTIDGDQLGVAGWSYNWTKQREPELIQGFGNLQLIKDKKDFDGSGRHFFYAQWVLGDAIDGFKPCEIAGKKFGVVSMYKLLGECKTDKECVEAVYKQYKTWYPAEVEYTDWTGKQQVTDAIGLMDMYAACCHMRRFPGDVFDTKKLLTKLQIIH